jgi:adenine phosphoribosyltransferase
MDLKKHIRSIPDYPKKGILFRDITTLIKDAGAFKYTNDKIIELAKNIDFDKVAAIESRGFIFASTVSYNLKKPFILLRKKNKLPAETHSVDFELEYGKATIEVHKDSIEKNEKILVIDDLIATGGTADAAAKLIEMSGGKVAAFIFVINLFDLPGEKLLKNKGYLTKSLVEFPGH